MEAAMAERRSSSRKRAFLQGRLYFDHRRTSIDCLVRDISHEGARLKFAHAPVTPEVFELHVPNRDETFRARVQWRTGEEIGVTFDGAEDAPLVPAAAPTDLAARVNRLERDLGLLQRKFNELHSLMRQMQGSD
jgi:hypothetical protein